MNLLKNNNLLLLFFLQKLYLCGVKPLIITIVGEPYTKAELITRFISKHVEIPLVPIYTDDFSSRIPGVKCIPRWLLDRIEFEEMAMKWKEGKKTFKAVIIDIEGVNLCFMGSSRIIKSFYFAYSGMYELVRIRIKNDTEKNKLEAIDINRQRGLLSRTPDWVFDHVVHNDSIVDALYNTQTIIKMEIEKWKQKNN